MKRPRGTVCPFTRILEKAYRAHQWNRITREALAAAFAADRIAPATQTG